jgi:GTPase SAR1 family protein
VYDVTSPDSFQHLGGWLDLVRKKCPEKVLPGVVVANKIDLEEHPPSLPSSLPPTLPHFSLSLSTPRPLSLSLCVYTLSRLVP